jgi:NADPH-dependent ferric siderophore reductase
MTTFATKPATRGWQGAVLRLLGADDFLLTVTGVDKITDHYVRVYFDDGGLLAHKGVHPTMWIRLWFDNDGKPHQRAYTLVDPDPVAGTFAIEFAIHDGPASQWAEYAVVGDAITSTVMGSSFALPTPAPDGWLIAGDAASLPAINSLLEAIAVSDSPDVPVTVWMEYQHDDEYALPLRMRDDHRVEWIARGADGTAIVDAVRADVFDATGYYGWVATEAASTRAIAALLRRDYGLGRAAVTSQAYWTGAH